MTAAIDVERVSKRYLLGERLGGYTTLRETLSGRVPWSRPEPRDELWALRDVTFQAHEGEVLGLIGHNGAGKTTVLKILARITHPTEGVSRTRGRVGALLDVGSGFHPELTGRENIHLNAAILGMRRHEVRARFDEIVEFAGLEQFLETPLKRYSWGMYLRLAFSVAAHVDPEVMVVDEVLAVGDVRFRDRCLGKMSEFGQEGRTVVFVSHDLAAVRRLCRRAIWLEQGRIHDDGRSEDVIERYIRSAVPRAAGAAFEPDPTQRVQLVSLSVVDDRGGPLDTPRRDEPLTLVARFVVRERIPGLDIALSLQNQRGVQVIEEDWGLDTDSSLVPERVPETYEARLRVPPVLPAGEYMVGVWIGTRFDTFVYQLPLAFRLWPSADDSSEYVERNRVVQPSVEWSVAAIGDDS
jgi:ABC-2 type transport system ATP-binding protein/lipopolysaccharide transport system ATP-binding protein